MASLCSSFLSAGCSSPQFSNPKVAGLLSYRDYTRSVAKGRRSAYPAARRIYYASRNDPVAIHQCFAEAHDRMEQPFVLAGEDMGLITGELEFLLYYLGDQRFAAALSRESPETRSAAGQFLHPEGMKGSFPQTQALLRLAPAINFPAHVATRKYG